jgi:hypothetical protein
MNAPTHPQDVKALADKVGDQNVTTQMATKSTLLNPRFYTTDFDKLDKIDVTPVREEWDALIERDAPIPTRAISSATEDWDKIDWTHLIPRTAQGVHRLPGQLADRRVLRLRALQGDEEARQEQGRLRAVLLYEPRRGPPCRLHQRCAQGVRHRRSIWAS